jgi:hypothetical protein
MKRAKLWSAPMCPRLLCRNFRKREFHKPKLKTSATSKSRRRWLLFVATLSVGFTQTIAAQNEPILVPSVVDYTKLLPMLPEAPSGWMADKPEGSTSDVGGFQITNVHRDYHNGEGKDAPLVSISILDSAANPDYVTATTATWQISSETPDGYSKSVTIDGNPGFEAYEREQKHASLWVMVAKRYFVQIEAQNMDPKQLQEWIKRVDLKKLEAIK